MLGAVRILVAVDFRRGSDEALRYALRHAPALGAAEVIYHWVASPEECDRDADGALEAAVARVRARVEALRGTLGLESGTKERFAVSLGEPAPELLEAATSQDVDVVIVGASDKSGFDRFFLGSVAERVVRGAPCTVTVVRPPRPRAGETEEEQRT
jgi:nucleotide-binding universal stress UspA family protein